MADQGQDFISLGLDISSFDDAKFKRVQDFITLFNKLDKYDGKAYNVVIGNGLVEFNASIKETSQLLTDINTKLTSLSSALNGTSGGSTKAAAGTKALTAEQAKLKVQLQEANKALIDQAKANNASVQARETQKKSIADQKRLEKELADIQKAAAAQDKKDKRDRILAERELARAKRQSISAEQDNIRTQQQESRTTERLISDYEQLKLAQKDQATNYANLFIAAGGKGNDANLNSGVKEAYATLEATSTQINQIERGLGKATQGAGNFGKTLTQGLSGLRTLAYVLPGIGIAGIFNLAFEAIGNVIEQFGLLGGAEAKQIEFVSKMREAWNDLEETYKKVYDQRQKLASFGEGSLARREFATELGAHEGENLNKQFPKQIEDLDERVRLAYERLHKNYGNSINDLSKFADEELNLIKDNSQEINHLQEIIDAHSGKTLFGINDDRRLEAEANLKKLKTENAALEFSYKNRIETLDEIYSSEEARAKLNADRLVFINDEKRKRIITNTKEDISVQQDRNDKILQAEISSERQKTEALIKLRKEQLRINDLDLFNVVGNEKLGIPKDTRATDDDVLIVRRKHADEILKINADFDKRQHEQDEQYNQRRLKSQSEIDQAEVNTGAIRDEKIANNEENSLQDRLEAYARYIHAKQLLQDIQYETQINQEKFKSKDPTALKELEAIDSERVEQKANIQADVEKKVYDIIYQSASKQLKLILDENKIEIDKNREKYGNEVRLLSDSYKNKEISYTKYKKRLKEIDDTFQRQSLDETIKQDEIAVDRIRQNLLANTDKLAHAEEDVSTKQQFLINAKENDPEKVPQAQEDFDTALGKQKGYLKAVQDGQVSLSNAQNKLKDDQFKRDNLRYTEDLKARRRYLQAVRQIEESLYRTIKEIGDREYQYRLEQLSLKKSTIDESYDSEIAAIERSSLSAKDKNALDIQLNAQKKQSDAELAREEKRIKHDQAIFDRDIAIAHIILSTAEAVAAALEFPALAVAAGIAGGAELVIASNVKIPGYEGGTKGKKHKGGLARTGEHGNAELILEPYKSPYLVFKDNISYLPTGTEVIPMRDIPELGGSVPKDDSWKQTMYLAKQIKKHSAVNVVNNINIDLGFQNYKRRILGQ